MLQITEQQAAAGLGSRWLTAQTSAATQPQSVHHKKRVEQLTARIPWAAVERPP